jgi:hypothetical protein
MQTLRHEVPFIAGLNRQYLFAASGRLWEIPRTGIVGGKYGKSKRTGYYGTVFKNAEKFWHPH